MIKIKINGKQIDFPTDWEDLTFKQFIDLWAEREGDDSMTKILSILSGVDISAATVVVGLDDMINMASFINYPSSFKTEYETIGPFKVKANTKQGWDIRFESLGQFEDMRALFKSQSDSLLDHTKKYARFVAIYLQKQRDGEYDSLKVDDMAADVMTYPAGQVIALGGFFFGRLLLSSRGIKRISPTTTQNPKKLKQALKSSSKRSARTPRLPKSRRR